jgi:DNA replication protein DnaC
VLPSPQITPKCLKCLDNEGYIATREDGSEYYKVCECAGKNKIDRAMNSSKITWEFQKKNFDNFSLEDIPSVVRGAYQCAQQYVNQFDEIKNTRKNSIALLGNPGCGKTHLMMAIANELMNRSVKVLYFPWVEGFNEIKDDLSQIEDRITKMQKVDVLFIDDMWKGRKDPTAFQIEQAFAIINHRYMEHKPTLISSERTIDQMCDFDEAIGSRINEMCKDYRVLLKGGRELNYRLREDAS